MSKRCKYNAEQKLGILQEYAAGRLSQEQISSKYDINKTTLHSWMYKYETFGSARLYESKIQKEYPEELRNQAVIECNEGRDSIRGVARKYGISSHSILLGWIKEYNGHRVLGRTRKGLSRAMTKGRATTWIERVEITEYCIANNKDYQKAVETYNVSYQQIYSWVKKYELGGINTLKDGRGRTKEETELTPQELQKLAIKKLEAENQRLRAEVAFLKKLEELERRRS